MNTRRNRFQLKVVTRAVISVLFLFQAFIYVWSRYSEVEVGNKAIISNDEFEGNTSFAYQLVSQQPISKWERLKFFNEESPDVTASIPNQFLDNYKSFCWFNDEQILVCLPSVYLAGFPKCGTSELYDKLVRHPLVFHNNLKEHQWWTCGRMKRGTKFNHYLMKLMTGEESFTENSILIDASPTLGWRHDSWQVRYPNMEDPPYYFPEVIHHFTPKAKIVFIVRTPTERTWSDFLAFARNIEQATPKEFHHHVVLAVAKMKDCLARRSFISCCFDENVTSRQHNTVTLVLGMYICFIPQWKREFGDQVMVLRLEDYSQFPENNLQKVLEFIGANQNITTEDIASIISKYNNKGNTRREEAIAQGDMLAQTRTLLDQFFEPFNKQLAGYLNDSSYSYTFG